MECRPGTGTTCQRPDDIQHGVAWQSGSPKAASTLQTDFYRHRLLPSESRQVKALEAVLPVLAVDGVRGGAVGHDLVVLCLSSAERSRQKTAHNTCLSTLTHLGALVADRIRANARLRLSEPVQFGLCASADGVDTDWLGDLVGCRRSGNEHNASKEGRKNVEAHLGYS